MNLNSLFIDCLRTRTQLINYQSVRWRRPRKPFWLGVAKSKKFLVPEPKYIYTPEESDQNISLGETYSTHLNSLLKFVRKNNPKLKGLLSELETEGKIQFSPALEKEIAKSYENNSIWNAESARRREERYNKEKDKITESVLRIIEEKEERMKKRLEVVEEIVKKEKLLSASYITEENIDEAIENCLGKIENFDFAIDLMGNKYEGSESLTPQLSSPKEKTTENTNA